MAKRCQRCNGSGTVSQGTGKNKVEKTCPVCNGTGEIN